MPAFQEIICKLNEAFCGNNIARLDQKLFESGDLADIGRKLGVTQLPNVQEEDAYAVLQSIPMAMREALRALVHANLGREQPYSMACVWLPGYDNEITITENPPTRVSPGGISVIFRTRYPLDRHPSKKGKKRKKSKKSAPK